MSKTRCILLAVSVLVMFACEKNAGPVSNTQSGVGSKVLSVIIDSENGTKATLADGNGTFRFTSGDAIKVHNGTEYTGTTVSNSNSGSFTMPDGFEIDRGGIVGFPAELVSGITSSSVTFTLPTTYTYSQVGSDNPNTCRAMAPMVGVYDAPVSGHPQVTLKQAGSVVRFKLTNIAAGRVSFTFSSKVTGEVTLSSPNPGSWGAGSGILAGNLSTEGSTITVNGVPDVADGTEYVYITLPVPTGTAPNEILVINTPDDGSIAYRQIDLDTGASALSRAQGRKISARPFHIREPKFLVSADRYAILSPGNLMGHISAYDAETHTAAVDEWRFQGPFDFIGNGSTTGNYLFYNEGSSDCVGEWVDMFAWQGTGSTLPVHGVILSASDSAYMGDYYSEGQTTYTGCWETNATNTEDPTYIKISNGGSYHWRLMNNTEWTYMLQYRTTSTLNGVENASFARVRIGSSDGLLLFPEDVGSKWNTSTMGAYPSSINSTGSYTWGTDTYTATQYGRMQEVGIMFLPKSGIYYNRWMMDRGFYWTNNASPIGYGKGATGSKYAYRMSVIDDHLYTTAEAHERTIAAAVRLVRDGGPYPAE